MKIYLWKYVYLFCTFIKIIFVKKANVTFPTHKSKFHCFKELFYTEKAALFY